MALPSSPAASGGPPAIPGARWSPTDAPVRPLLLWVRTGTAHVRLDDGPTLHLGAGEGVWIPADGPVGPSAGDRGGTSADRQARRTIVTEPGTVAFPLSPHPGVGARGLPELTRFDVPGDWQDWLIQLFNLQVTPFNDHGYSPEALAELLRRPGTRPPKPKPTPKPTALGENAGPGRGPGLDLDGGLDLDRGLDLGLRGGLGPASRPGPVPEGFASPVMPRTRGARAVAEELMHDPALDLTVERWAARVLSSARTLRRDFLADTGLTFEQWRLHCRLGAAVEFLAAGYDVDQVAALVGFASRNGLTRAFKGRFGLTPHEFGRRFAARPGSGGLTRRATAARQTDDLLRMMRETDPPAAPEMLPPASTPSHTNDVHVLSWMYRGSGYLDIGDRRHERERGVATWIPAKLEHVTGLRENSVSLPLGNASTADLHLTAPLQVRFSPAWDDYLMFCSISARSPLRPDDHDPRHILDLFAEQVAARRALSVPMPTDPRARAVALDCLRRIGEPGGTHDTETAGPQDTGTGVRQDAGADGPQDAGPGGRHDAAADGPHDPDLRAEIHRAFREETGMTLARWRYAARMRVARDLLAGGAPPSTVARRTGYAHLPTFSTAFSRFHGLSPRAYQERETTEDR
ncbi:helix-turn-helix domain-containing protein [Streptomyces sp. NPDC091281]|uniref:helix-turn-helix domain-containing protein n=1 Tax=Streptomyces sp. NPDC091281 TaxID=3365985 RepID=UPI003814C59F